MIRLAPSLVAAKLRAATLAFSLVAPVTLLTTDITFAQQQADPLSKAVEDVWHYGKIARYDVALAKIDEVLASAGEPVKVLEAFEKVASERGDNLDEWLIRWQGVAQIKDKSAELAKVINEGRFTRRADPAWINKNIDRLANGDRPYRLAMTQLRESGELAVPFLLQRLADPGKQNEHGPVRSAIVDLGRLAVNPLVAATESDNPATLAAVSALLGEIGYDAAVPYLARLAESGADEVTKQAASAALQKVAGGNTAKAGDLFFDLAEKIYYGRSSLTADARFPTANVWHWDGPTKGLLRTPVPPSIFNDVMAMRASEYALTLGTSQDALSLWLAANYKREADLPEGGTDGTRQANQPNAHYYGVTAGTQYLNAALARALNDRNSAVALKAVKSLQDIVGDSNFKSGGASPLIEAMQYGDRRVRFEAAFTLAAALPQSTFAGQEQVVPLLAEAISQTGQPSVLVVMPTQEAVNAIVTPLKGENYIATGAIGAAAALSAATAVPAIDVVVISDELPATEIESLLGLIAQSPKVRGAAKLFIVKSTASQWETRKATDKSIATTTSSDAGSVKAAVLAARESTGALPLDPKLATEYATRAGALLKGLAISRGQVLDLSPARSTLLGALEDSRPEIIKLAGEALALLNNDDSQRGLLIKATTDGVADDVKISLFKSVATSAKFFGNKLEQKNQLDALDGVVKGATNADVKNAAAEARGALNLPSDQARTLILDQSRR